MTKESSFNEEVLLNIKNRMVQEKYELFMQTGWEEFAKHSYTEASTDRITEKCRISKGLLFHYFGSKDRFYLCCLNEAMRCLIQNTKVKSDREISDSKETVEEKEDFYEIIFSNMHRKILLCKDYSMQMRMVNMASKEQATAVTAAKNAVIQHYTVFVKQQSEQTLQRALKKMKLKDSKNPYVMNGLNLYVTAIINQYLLQYQNDPEAFIEKEFEIRQEIQNYIDLMLDGIKVEEQI